jgi:hypothetical protein
VPFRFQCALVIDFIPFPSPDLDMEYRYWAFVEDHPAHVSLPLLARREAMDVLTWARTGAFFRPLVEHL